jgi:hypothetical protein
MRIVFIASSLHSRPFRVLSTIDQVRFMWIYGKAAISSANFWGKFISASTTPADILRPGDFSNRPCHPGENGKSQP